MSEKPYILVTNDDGIHAEGIAALAAALKKRYNVVVIAPDREQSAVAHSVTMHHPIRARKLEEDVIVIDGTPTDCVMFGVLGFLERKPDLIVSGINNGPNMGDDVTYSGTVSAALEATLLKIPGFAISLNKTIKRLHLDNGIHHFASAAEVAVKISEEILQSGLPSKTFLNVNVPDIPFESIEGYEVTRLGKRVYNDRIIRRTDPMGRDYYWIGGEEPTWVSEPGTDFFALERDYVSVTPLRYDLTATDAINELQDWNFFKKFSEENISDKK